MSWNEPVPDPPKGHEMSLSDWYIEIGDEFGWDSPELEFIAIEAGGCWDNDYPQRHLTVELAFTGPFYSTTITSTHHFDDKECLHGRSRPTPES